MQQGIKDEWSAASYPEVTQTEPPPAPGAVTSQTREAGTVFSFDPVHIAAVTMAVDTTTVQTQPVFHQNATFTAGFPANPTRFHSPLLRAPYSSNPWMRTAGSSQYGQHPMHGSVFRPPMPNTVMRTQPRSMYPAPTTMASAFSEHLYQLQQQYQQLPMERYPRVQHSISPTTGIHHRVPQPPLWKQQLSGESSHASGSQMPTFNQIESAPLPPIPQVGYSPSTSQMSDVPRTIYRVEQPWAVQRQARAQGQRHTTSSTNIIRPIPVYAATNQPPPPPHFEVNKPPQSIVCTSKTSKEASSSSLLQQTEDVIVGSRKPMVGERVSDKEEPFVATKQPKKRSFVDEDVDAMLETEFYQNRSPTQAEITELAQRFCLTKGAVRQWFSNRRQRQKTMDRESRLAEQKRLTEAESVIVKVPSEQYEITVEVPSINPKDRGSVLHKDYKRN